VIEGKLEGRIEMKGRQGIRRKQLLDDLKGKEKILEIERGSTISYAVENSLWKRLRTCRKTDYRMNESTLHVIMLFFLNPIQTCRMISYVATISLQDLYIYYTTNDTHTQ
jgi:hypothetical protein